MSAMLVPPLRRSPGGSRRSLDACTQGLSTTSFERPFARDAPEALTVLVARKLPPLPITAVAEGAAVDV